MILRYVFHSPTSWIIDITLNLHLVAMFTTGAYTFGIKGHVRVDILLDALDKKFPNRKPRRILCLIAYCFTIIYLSVMLYGCVRNGLRGLQFHQMTVTSMPIPIAILYSVMVAGLAWSLTAVVFIILDLLSGSQEYL